jgi:hypothetical protein
MLTVHPAMKLTLEIAATGVAAAALAGCGGDGNNDAVTKRTQAELGDTFVVHSCTATGEERDDLRWYDCSVTDPDHDEPRTWTVAVDEDNNVANAQPPEE